MTLLERLVTVHMKMMQELCVIIVSSFYLVSNWLVDIQYSNCAMKNIVKIYLSILVLVYKVTSIVNGSHNSMPERVNDMNCFQLYTHNCYHSTIKLL